MGNRKISAGRRRPRLYRLTFAFGVCSMETKNHARAVRYRQLALAEPDKVKAAVLFKIADEAERNVLCTVERTLVGQAGLKSGLKPTNLVVGPRT